MKLLLAGGGTGGHLIPGLAVAEALRRRDPDCEIWVFGTPRPIDRRVVPAAGIELIEQPVRPFSTRPWHWPGFYLAWRASCRTAREFILKHRPNAVLGLGGYAAGPAVVVAHKLGIPTAILNPDAVPGRANRFLAKRVDRVFCQWDVTIPLLPRRDSCRVVGSPVRAGLDKLDKRECRRALGLDENRPLLLVTGASLGAATINEAVPAALELIAEKLAGDWQVLHQTGGGKGRGDAGTPGRRDGGTGGEKDAARARGREGATEREYAETIGNRENRRGVNSYRTVDFIDRMDWAIAAADLVVCRAGASTLAELAAIGRPAILMPYPFHRDQHQRHNGQVLVDAGAAVMIEDTRELEGNVAQLVGPLAELMTDSAKREAMGQAARKIGKPAAAEAVVDELLRLA